MAQSRSRRIAAEAVDEMRSRNKRQWMIAGGVLIAAVLIGYIGWQLRGGGPSGPVTVARTFTGTITVLNDTRDAGCVAPDGGGSPVCSEFAVVPGTQMRQGSKVRVAREWRRNNDGTRTDLLLVYSPS